ncbi:MAG: hypothetical protein PF517_17650 [Salinivirgaceae bacterium]|jgi:hypothetical protein|nr:hypothetical protein [Salinivirgaceae bacterium]
MKKRFGFLAITMVASALAFVSCDKDDEKLPEVKACFEFTPATDIEKGDTVSFSNCSSEAEKYTWKSNNEIVANDEHISIVFEDEGEYIITLIAENGNAVDSVTQSVLVSYEPETMSYIINYGSYSGDKSTITLFNEAVNEVENGYYNSVNNTDMVSNVQYAYEYNGTFFFMGNNADQVFYVDAQTFEQTKNGITTDIVKPRYCVGNENTLYVSCWGGDIWTDISFSYIAKVDLITNEVTAKIALPGGPEGLEIANGKLYAALNYMDSVAVIDLANNVISYIATPAVSSYFVKDESENLYVSLLSTYGNPSDKTGLGYINTSSDTFEASYDLAGISTGYVNILAPNNDLSKIYTLASSWVEEADGTWVQKGSVAVFDVASKAFETAMFVEGVAGINGVAVDKTTGNILVMVAESATANGKVMSYKADGTLNKEYETGIAPFMMLTVE